ncbi:MAG: hypothetical protein IJP82_01650 [Bacteroidaceae bacterium]|nr:hypothetical protein [Bacteroidaceae bacterium]
MVFSCILIGFSIRFFCCSILACEMAFSLASGVLGRWVGSCPVVGNAGVSQKLLRFSLSFQNKVLLLQQEKGIELTSES